MVLMILGFLFLLGICVGSFINCVVWRLNHNRSPLFGRSICPRCKHQLAWYDNIPLLSFALLRGKCRWCHSPISWQYPIVELVTGLLTVFVFQLTNYELRIAGCYLLITYSLLVIFVSDLLYTTIPEEIVYPTIGLVLFANFFTLIRNPQFVISGLGAAGFFYLLVLLTRGRGMGMGDVKLAGLMGLILGWPRIIVALYLAFLTGAIVGVILVLLEKKKFGQHIPFGPFLTTATFISLFWGDKIWQWGGKILGLQ
ncbi:MAG: prepilin peptidase [Microgenomates group bacterium]